MKRSFVRKRIACAILLGIAFATPPPPPPPAFAGPTYLETFNSGANGWDEGAEAAWQASGGVGNTGFFQGHRDGASPNYGEANTGVAAANTLGNLEAVFGNQIQFSYDGKVFQGPVSAAPTQGFFTAGGTTFWTKVVGSNISNYVGAWAPVSFAIDTNWTDAQAVANGWQREIGTASWSTTLHNVSAEEVFYRLAAPGVGGAPFVTGIDNFEMDGNLTATPEPGTLTLLGIGIASLGFYGWRKRKAAAA